MWSLCIFIILLLIILVLYYKYVYNSNNGKEENVKTLTRQCARWLIASLQDESPMIAILHCQYGMGYLWAIGDICTDSEFERITGKDWKKFVKKATAIQDKVTRRMAQACPQFTGDIDKYFLEIGN